MNRTSIFRAVFPERGLRKRALASVGAAIVVSIGSPATAAEPETRLIRCGEQNCLQISGRRDDPAMIISINGHAVPAEGGCGWRVRLPVEVVQQWSAPHARTIEVSLHDPATRRETAVSVDLPIGLLGGTTDLASLIISVR